jgi:hypothetical protein
MNAILIIMRSPFSILVGLPWANERNVPRLPSFAFTPFTPSFLIPTVDVASRWTLRSYHHERFQAFPERHRHAALFLASCWRKQPTSCTSVMPMLPSGARSNATLTRGWCQKRHPREDGQGEGIRTCARIRQGLYRPLLSLLSWNDRLSH